MIFILDLQPFILTFLRLLLGSVFLASSMGKISQPRRFIATIGNYKLIYHTWVRSVAFSIIAAEVVVAFLLLIGWWSRLAAALSGALLVFFILAVDINLIRGRTDLECGCLGLKHTQKINLKLVWRNFFLLLIALFVIQWGGGLLSLDNQSSAWQRYFMTEILLPFVLISSGLLILFKLILQLYRLILLMPLEE